MSEINKRFVLYKTRADFDTQLQTGGGISEDAIVFIEDEKSIYTHGKFYSEPNNVWTIKQDVENTSRYEAFVVGTLKDNFNNVKTGDYITFDDSNGESFSLHIDLIGNGEGDHHVVAIDHPSCVSPCTALKYSLVAGSSGDPDIDNMIALVTTQLLGRDGRLWSVAFYNPQLLGTTLLIGIAVLINESDNFQKCKSDIVILQSNFQWDEH